MINDIKLGIKSLGYAYGVKGSCTICVLFLVFGILTIIFGERIGLNVVIGVYFLMCSSLFPAQMLYSLSISGMLLASPVRKRIQTTVPAVINGCWAMLVYLIIALCRSAVAIGSGEMGYELCNELLAAALLGVLIMVYSAIAYKFFLVSFIMFFIAYFLGMCYMRAGGVDHTPGIFGPDGMPGSFPLALALGAALIVIGGFLEYLVSLLVYRAPMSKMAQPASLRREL